MGGKVTWQDEKVAIRWFLAVRMARSAGRGAEAAVMVGGKVGGRQRGERKESSVGGSRDREGWNRKDPKLRRESFRPSEERVGGGGSAKEGHRGRGKDGMTVRAQKKGDAHKGM